MQILERNSPCRQAARYEIRGVDKRVFLLQLYQIFIRSIKWNLRVIFHFVLVSITNSCKQKRTISSRNILWISSHSLTSNYYQKASTFTNKNYGLYKISLIYKKRVLPETCSQVDVRFDQMGQWPVVKEKQQWWEKGFIFSDQEVFGKNVRSVFVWSQHWNILYYFIWNKLIFKEKKNYLRKVYFLIHLIKTKNTTKKFFTIIWYAEPKEFIASYSVFLVKTKIRMKIICWIFILCESFWIMSNVLTQTNACE